MCINNLFFIGQTCKTNFCCYLIAISLESSYLILVNSDIFFQFCLLGIKVGQYIK